MRLTDKRLLGIAKQLQGAKSFADIGSDHGKLPVYAIVNGIVDTAIATDISELSLQKTRNLANALNVSLSTRVGDGLSVLKPFEVECVVIAGMGGHEIVKILKHRLKDFDKYIFIPHKNPYIVRQFLKANDIGIVNDKVIKEGKFFYHMITCSILDKWNISHNLYVGRDNSVEDKDFADYLLYRISTLNRLIAQSKGDSIAFAEEKRELEKWQK